MNKYRAWISQARAFVAQWGSSPHIRFFRFESHPPLSNYEVAALSSGLRTAIPAPISEFLLEACSGFSFAYWWDPPSDSLKSQIMEDIGCFSLLGGANWNAESLSDYQETVEALMQANKLGIDDDRAVKLFPFWHVGNGDLLALDTSAASSVQPVVYVSFPGETPCTEIASSFDSFLVEWERMCYFDLGLASYKLINPRTGLMDSSIPQAELLRKLLGTPGA